MLDHEDLRVHPRWIFRKNSIEFSIVFYTTYTTFYIVYVLKPCNHMSFWNILQSPDLVM